MVCTVLPIPVSRNENVGVTKLDRIRNERIRGTTKVGEISKKVQESRLKWYNCVLRREEEYVGKRVMVVPGKRRRGRPKRRWLDNIQNDLLERELSWEEAQDRVEWRRLIRNIKVGNDVEEDCIATGPAFRRILAHLKFIVLYDKENFYRIFQRNCGTCVKSMCTLHQNGVCISAHDIIYKHIIQTVTECLIVL